MARLAAISTCSEQGREMVHVQVGIVTFGTHPATYLTSLFIHVRESGFILCRILAAKTEFGLSCGPDRGSISQK